MGFFSAVERKMDDDITDFTLQMKVKGKFQGKILNWFVELDLGAISPKNMFYYWHVIEQWDAAEL